MAYIRAFGGGISSALKSAMNAVLNKKFGTSTTYAPEDWPEDVNLLGPLPEKTASGAIANITDGADTVPIKAWDVTVDANLDGVSSVVCTQAGKNLLDESLKKLNGRNIYYNSGINQNDGYSCVLPAGTYTFSVTTADGTITNLYARNYDTATNISGFPAYAVLKKTFSLTETTRVSFWVYKDTYTSLSDIVNAQVEVGSSNTAHADYIAPTVTTVSLGRTIYGGSVDVVNGTGIDGFSNPVSLNSLTWYPTTIGGNVCFYADLPSGYMGTGSATFEGVCSSYSVTNDGNMGTDQTIMFYYNANYNFSRVSIRDDQYASLTGAQFKEAVSGNIVYKLAEASQTDFTFTPMTPTPDTALGVNNFWADTGDSEVTYRADIALALAANSSRGLMMASRSIPEDEILNENTEEVENDENIRQDSTDR